MSAVLPCAFSPELLNFYLFLAFYALGLCLAILYCSFVHLYYLYYCYYYHTNITIIVLLGYLNDALSQ